MVEAVQVALDLGNDINAVDKNGETAMHGAAYKNLPAARCEFLASKGAKIEVWNRKNKHGWTPLTHRARATASATSSRRPMTIAAFHKVMTAAGVPIPTEPVVSVGRKGNWKSGLRHHQFRIWSSTARKQAGSPCTVAGYRCGIPQGHDGGTRANHH